MFSGWGPLLGPTHLFTSLLIMLSLIRDLFSWVGLPIRQSVGHTLSIVKTLFIQSLSLSLSQLKKPFQDSYTSFVISYVLARIRDPTIGIRANSCFEPYWFDTCEVSTSSAVDFEAIWGKLVFFKKFYFHLFFTI